MNHIILIGFMGSGKSSVGKKLARAMELSFVDTDDLIEEQAHMKITDIFEEYGEEYFRDLETLTLRQLLDAQNRLVIAVGGGMPMRSENRNYLKQLGTVIYLKAEVDTLVERLQGDTSRPMLKGRDLKTKIRDLMQARGSVYQETADIDIVTDQKGCRRIVEEIKRHV